MNSKLRVTTCLYLAKFHAEQNKTESFSLVTFEPWLIVVISQHVFRVNSSMTIFHIPIT